ncbi:MAG: tRNA (N(6)-L-threonylcarbamoyladenosine(37)-C(2))-methylthiotransferase MtaB [Candidatus Omnitrophota bacterium]
MSYDIFIRQVIEVDRFFIKTLGCKVNQCDSEALREKLLALGMREAFEKENADLSIVNTCCVTATADRKSRYAVRVAAKRKGRGLLVVIGCYPGYDRLAIERIKGVDGVFSNAQRKELLDWIKQRQADSRKRESLFLIDANAQKKHIFGHKRAFLKVQDGCDNRCSYCIIPTVRGGSKSRCVEDVIEEANRKSGEGFKEIVLTGVCLGAYGRDFSKKVDLIDLIGLIEQVPDVQRIRLSSIEASDVTDRLIEKMASSSKLCPHLHIPFQSGDDQVLTAMKKRLKVSSYKKIVEKAKKKINNLAITCDFIVGFPVEEETNFMNTLDFIKFVKPARVHVFPYSKRNGAVEFSKFVEDKVMQKRLVLLRDLSRRMSDNYCRSFIGKELGVLFEVKRGGYWQGYSENYIKFIVASNRSLANSLKSVKMNSLAKDQEHCVFGVLV